ncbi:hypothetical protein OG788_42790 [Streptomyces sp. NBC_00647]
MPGRLVRRAAPRLYKEVTREQVETAMARARAEAAAPIVARPSSPAP